MKNVLLISAANIDRGGVQKFLLDWVRVSPHEDYRYVWYCPGRVLDEGVKKEFIEEGVFVCTGGYDKLSSLKTYFKVHTDICRIIKEEKIDVIHVNTGTTRFQALALFAAKRSKVDVRIAHSHSSMNSENENVVNRLLHLIFQSYVNLFVTKRVACSHNAAVWLFGEKFKNNVSILKNKIDVKQYAFNKEIRNEYRNKLGLDEDVFLCGAVGALNSIKNHDFLISVFKELKSERTNIKLIIIGQGELKEFLSKKIEALELDDCVELLGVSDKVWCWLQAMDLFLMPSTHEGFPISILEAQAAGLPCVLSCNITKEVQMSELISFVPITEVENWKVAIKNMMKSKRDCSERMKGEGIVCRNGYSLKETEREIVVLYETDAVR